MKINTCSKNEKRKQIINALKQKVVKEEPEKGIMKRHLRKRDIIIILIIWMYPHVKTYQTICFKYMQFITCQLHMAKAFKNLCV